MQALSGAAPGYWMYETSGVLRPAVEAYLQGERMTPQQIAAMRAYLRQWIFAPCWQGEAVALLRQRIDEVTTRAAMNRWIYTAIEEGIDPL